SDDARAALNEKPGILRAIGAVSGLNGREAGASSYAVNLFGKPVRAINCDCERSAEPNLLQLVYLRNDQEVEMLLDRREGWLKQLRGDKGAKLDRDELIRDAYLRTLSRLPQENEVAAAREHFAGASDPL